MAHALEALVRKLQCEANLTDEEKQAVLDLPATIRLMRPDHDIVRDRDRPTQCCLVLEGWLCRYKILESGGRQIMSFHVPGDIPDLQSLHLNTMDHSLGTLTQSTVAFIQHESLRKLIRAFPRISDILWRDTLIDAAIFREWIAAIGRRQAPERIAHMMCEMFTKLRSVGLAKEHSCPFPLTQAAIADALGLSTVHVNRSIMDLRSRGLITLEKQILTIPDWGELQAFGGFDPLYLHMENCTEMA